MARSGTSPVPAWVLFGDAALEAVNEAGLKVTDMQGLHFGNGCGANIEQQMNMSPLVLAVLGIETNIPCARYEAACCTGSAAFRQGYMNILAGKYDILLVGGAERLRSVEGSVVQQVFAYGMDESERRAGLTFGAYWAFVARAYGRKYGLSDEKLQELLGEISVKSHYHGSFNKRAHFQKQISGEDVKKSPVICPPMRLLDLCPFSDGAAALVIASEKVARRYKNPVWIEGSGHASGKFRIADCDDLSVNPAIAKAVNEAYAQAKVGPKDIEVAEVHDCSDIHEVLCIEGAGLFKQGEGIYSAAEHKTYFDGEMPVNLSGGLKSRGHPVGATGAYQLCEITRLLRGDWDGSKPPKQPEIGLTVNVGGTGTIVTSHVLRKG